jgi:hypothetical protein
MLKKVLLIAASLGFSGAALAHPPEWAPAHGWRGHHEHYYEHYRPYYVAPRPVYVMPAPRVVYAQPAPVVVPGPVYPAPVYPAPVYQAPAPVYGSPSVSIRLNLPL